MKHVALLSLLLHLALVAEAQRFLYVQSLGDTLTVIPAEQVNSYAMSAGDLCVKLKTGKALIVPNATSVGDECPVELPRFTHYRFNEKPNDQLFQSVATPQDMLSQDTIRLDVAQIGKSLTATFQLTDAQAAAYVGTVRQLSKQTRQRMDAPVDYTLGRGSWRLLQTHHSDQTGTTYRYVPFGRRVTVDARFPTDRPDVPHIHITTATGNVPLSKTDYIGATITIDGRGIFPDMPAKDISIKGRGNTSWATNSRSKNSYHIRFPEKQRPLGMAGGKHWVLLSNKLQGSMMSNAIAQKAAALAGCAAPCHIVPVELYINGDYRGSYNLTEKVGFHSNSVVPFDASRAAMLELDTYQDDSIWRSNAYNIATKIHAPDFDDDDSLLAITPSDIIADWDKATQVLCYGQAEDYTKHFDVARLVSFLFQNELCYNTELSHPKSVFLYSEDVLDDDSSPTQAAETPWVFGPVWDQDWCFGYNVGSAEYFVNCADEGYYKKYFKGFFRDLRFKSQAVDAAYYRLCHDFIADGRLQELIDYARDYYHFASASLAHNQNNATFDRDYTDYAALSDRAGEWLRKRAAVILASLDAYPIEEPEAEELAAPIIIDTEDGLHTIPDSQFKQGDEPMAAADTYNLAGQRIARQQRGIVVTKGKKVIRK